MFFKRNFVKHRTFWWENLKWFKFKHLKPRLLCGWTTSLGFFCLYILTHCREAEKERRPQQKWVTFIQARRGDSRPNDQADCREGTGRRHTYREVCGSDKGNVNQAGYFEYSFVEMTFVVGQGMISPWIDATGLEHQGGTKILFRFLRS